MSKVFEICDKKWQTFTSSSPHLSSVSKVDQLQLNRIGNCMRGAGRIVRSVLLSLRH